MNLNDLSQPSFWAALVSEKSSKIPLVVVLPSGRCRLATSGHLALISDALHTHEIVIAIDDLGRKGGTAGVEVHSMLDIDYYDFLAEYRATDGNPDQSLFGFYDFNVVDANLLLLATADINVVTKLVLEECKSEENYGVGFKKPYESCMIVGATGKTYAVTAYPNVGVLAMYPVPWINEGSRVVLLCGGVLAPGTLGANVLLQQYLSGNGDGNNRANQDLPVKIVSAYVRDYRHVSLLPTAECIPNHELRNIRTEIVIHE